MKVIVTDHYVLPLPTGHRFPASKYRLLREAVQATDRFPPDAFVEASAVTDEELLRVHDPGYLFRMATGELTREEQNRIGFPWSERMVERSRRTTGATILACRTALHEGICCNLAGGTHHAFRDKGEGFCIYNDTVVAARAMQAEGLAHRFLVIDLDVHQGNGTAALTRDDPTIFTFSVHGANNYPHVKEQSDLDVELPDRTADEEYLAALEPALWEALYRARADLVIYIAGADPYLDDRLGRLALTKDGLARRDAMVYSACSQRHLPVAVTMAGGYARDIHDTVDIHARTVTLAEEWCRRWGR